jgi:hypothetical protein
MPSSRGEIPMTFGHIRRARPPTSTTQPNHGPERLAPALSLGIGGLPIRGVRTLPRIRGSGCRTRRMCASLDLSRYVALRCARSDESSPADKRAILCAGNARSGDVDAHYEKMGHVSPPTALPVVVSAHKFCCGERDSVRSRSAGACGDSVRQPRRRVPGKPDGKRVGGSQYSRWCAHSQDSGPVGAPAGRHRRRRRGLAARTPKAFCG